MRRSELQLAEHEQDDQHDNNHPDDTDPAIAAHAASSELTGTCAPGLPPNLHRGSITSIHSSISDVCHAHLTVDGTGRRSKFVSGSISLPNSDLRAASSAF
jgi:hypothetical protein